MKTRNCKLSLLVIFLALCFTIYAGNCYSQVFDYMNTYYTGNQWDIGYPFDIGNSSIRSFGYLWERPFYFFVWLHPAGKTTLDLLLETVPNLNITYEDFYGIEYKPYDVFLQFDYDILRNPILDNLNIYQNPEFYVLPLYQRNTLYNFTKDFAIQPIMPDFWGGYGAIGYGMGSY